MNHIEIFYLKNVTMGNKDELKQLGAKWYEKKGNWYIPITINYNNYIKLINLMNKYNVYIEKEIKNPEYCLEQYNKLDKYDDTLSGYSERRRYGDEYIKVRYTKKDYEELGEIIKKSQFDDLDIFN